VLGFSLILSRTNAARPVNSLAQVVQKGPDARRRFERRLRRRNLGGGSEGGRRGPLRGKPSPQMGLFQQPARLLVGPKSARFCQTLDSAHLRRAEMRASQGPREEPTGAYDQARLRRDSVPAKVLATTAGPLRPRALPAQARGEVRKGGVPPSGSNEVWRS